MKRDGKWAEKEKDKHDRGGEKAKGESERKATENETDMDKERWQKVMGN